MYLTELDIRRPPGTETPCVPPVSLLGLPVSHSVRFSPTDLVTVLAPGLETSGKPGLECCSLYKHDSDSKRRVVKYEIDTYLLALLRTLLLLWLGFRFFENEAEVLRPSGQSGQGAGLSSGHSEAESEVRAGLRRKLWSERRTAHSSSLNTLACLTVFWRPEMRTRPRPWDRYCFRGRGFTSGLTVSHTVLMSWIKSFVASRNTALQVRVLGSVSR